MLRTALLSLALPLIALPALAGPQAVVQETIVDVGTVTQGTEIVHEFKVQNTGDADLEITEVKASCGCMVASFARFVKPGRVGLVKLVVDTADFATPIAKGATLFTTDPGNPRVQLVVKANVKAVVKVSPSYARFIVVQGEPYEATEHTLEAPAQQDFRVTKLTSPYPFLKASLSEEAGDDAAAAKWKVVLELQAGAPIGPMADFVVASTNHPKMKEVKIPVSGYVRPPVVALPGVYDFGSRTLEDAYSGAVEVQVLSSRSVTLGEATVDRSGVEASVEEIEEGRRYNVVIRLDPALPTGRLDALISVATGDEAYPVLEIPITGEVL